MTTHDDVGGPTRGPREGCYCLLQFVPDLERAEGVNVGVALFDLGTGRAHVALAADHARVRRRFPTLRLDDVRLTYAKTSLKRRLEAGVYPTRAAIEAFASREANALVVLPPRAMVLGDVQADLRDLMRELVDAPDA